MASRRMIPLFIAVAIAAGGFLVAPVIDLQADPGHRTRKKSSSSSAGKKMKKGGTSTIPQDKEGEQLILKELGEKFKLKRTPHYSIFYDTSEEDVEVFGFAIEKTYTSCAKYVTSMKLEYRQPDEKLFTHFFNNFDDYSAHSEKVGLGRKDPNTAGFYYPMNNMSYFYNYRNRPEFKSVRDQAERNMNAMRDRRKRGAMSKGERAAIKEASKQSRFTVNRTNTYGGELTESILQHEVAHQVLWNVGFHNPKTFIANPRWFAEGTAQLFEPISDGKSVNLGQVNAMRLDHYNSLYKGERLFPLREFVSKADFFHGPLVGEAYAQSWALVHYLNRMRRKELINYIEMLLERPDDFESTPDLEIETFEKAFGKLDEKWEKRWKDWMQDVR